MSNTVYKDFATIYDDVMANEFAEKWLVAFNQIKNKHQIKFKTLADIGCGTGVIAERFKKKLRNLYLVDQSEEMLKRAKKRCPDSKTIKADIRRFDLPEQVELVISVYGILHYLMTNSDLKQYFKQVKKILQPQGYFCFDYFTEKHIKKYFGGGTEVFEGNQFLSIWHHRWNGNKKCSDIIVEGFQKKGNYWERHRPELHRQKAFTWSVIKMQLKEAGFRKIRQYSLQGLAQPHAADEKRIVIVQP